MIAPFDDLQPEGLRVLVVEDGPVYQRLALGLLTKQGYDVTLTCNGQQAVDLLKHEDFDVILMDVEMPIMDGLTATGLIRAREKTSGRHTPVVAVTSTSDSQRCLAAGMDAFIHKPLKADLLNQTLQQVLSVD